MDYRVIEMPRLLEGEEAEATVGTIVPQVEPNLREAAVVIDADTGEPIVGYLPMERDATHTLRAAVLGIGRWDDTLRASTGLKNKSRTFGMAPRRPLKRLEGCRQTALATEAPEHHHTITHFSYYLADQLKTLFPEVYAHDREVLDRVAQDWRMAEDAMWTSGVINKTAELPYHRDGFNFQTWSAMPVLRRGTAGGHLHFPEYGLTVECRDGWAVYFCGHDYIHGVTPITMKQADGYRYSVVYYALRGMKDCFTYAAETAYAQKTRTRREDHQAELLRQAAAEAATG